MRKFIIITTVIISPKIILRIFCQILEMCFTHLVVAVGEGYPLATGVVEAEVAGGGDAAVGLVENADAGVTGSIFVADGGAAVGGAVVDEQQLKVGVGLRQYRVDAPPQILFGIVDGHYDGNLRRGHRSGI